MTKRQHSLKVGIIGAGHNGLVCAAYLAQAGFNVSVFEKRKIVGGLCVTEELIPGYRVSSVASYFGMLREQIISDLRLSLFGLQPYLTDPAEIVLLPQDQFVYTPRDGSDSQLHIRGLEESDRIGWNQFWSDMSVAAELVGANYLTTIKPNADVCADLKRAGLEAISDLIFDGSLIDLMSRYISNKGLMAVAATCTPGFASQPGSVFGCLHHGTAKTAGVKGAWGLVKGGMGTITECLYEAATRAGAKVHTASAVESIRTTDGKADGLVFASGKSEDFDIIISNADPFTTFLKLLPDTELLSELRDVLERRRPRVSAGKVHFALSGLPSFPILDQLAHNYSGVIVLAPELQSVINDSLAVSNGQLPEQLMMTMAFPSLTDDSIAPPGKQLLTIDIHYLPTELAGSKHWNQMELRQLQELCVKTIEQYSPSFRQHIDHCVVIGPQELRSTYNLETASCWHLSMSAEYIGDRRQLPGCIGYRTPITNLYLCGASTYPGGNVTGACGYNCARDIKGAFHTLHIESTGCQT